MPPPQIDRSPELWPYKQIEPRPGQPVGDVPLDACFLSVKNMEVVNTARDFALSEATYGSKVTESAKWGNALIQGGLREELGKLLRVPAKDITLKGNTCDGIVDIALGYPFDKGDNVVVYRGDYPSVFIPFLAREDLNVKFLNGVKDPVRKELDLGWKFEELEAAVDSRTKMLVISHVQYKSGQTASLKELGDFCADRRIRLVVDIAQSVGAAPVYPIDHRIDAVVFPFWKGLLSPRGGGALYMTPEFREELDLVRRTPSAQDMKTFGDVDAPFHTDGRLFEASTHPTQLFAETLTSIRTGVGKYGIDAVAANVSELQRLFAKLIDPTYAHLVTALDRQTGLIVSFTLPHHVGKEGDVVKTAFTHGVRVTARDGFLRVAPHYFNSPEEVEHAANILNGILSGKLK